MLDSMTDRLDYGEILQPPEGYELENAIATTYSADLSTVLSIPVALFYAQTLDGHFSGVEFQLLDTIERFSGSVRIFHQHGQLHVPKAQTRLFAYLESVFVPVHLQNEWASFHPKTWLIRYRDPSSGSRLFRVIVLSRNLTFDRSWDVAARLDGTVGDSPVEQTTPLVEFARYLKGIASENDSFPWLDEFILHLSNTSFELPEGFDNLGFHPIGPPFSRTNPALHRDAHEGLVISPFLHRDALRQLRGNVTARFDLLSEPCELSKLPRDLLESLDKTWQLREEIVWSELSQETGEAGDESRLHQLHAKAFFFWTGASYGRTHVYLGSANATRAAYERNIEFLLELECPRSWLNQEKVRGELLSDGYDGNDKRPFEVYVPPEDIEADDHKKHEQEFRRFEHTLLSSNCHGWLEPAASGENYDLLLRLDLSSLAGNGVYSVSVRPLTVAKGFPLQPVALGELNVLAYRGISKVDLCRFFVFRVADEKRELAPEFVRFVPVDGMPEDRLGAITRKIIDSREKFFAYLRLLIASEIRKEDVLAAVQEELPPHDRESDASRLGYRDMPIFEEMLVAASRDPAKIARASKIIAELKRRKMEDNEGEPVIPPEFVEFWKAFEGYTE